jgi:hypothetical protein
VFYIKMPAGENNQNPLAKKKGGDENANRTHIILYDIQI